MTDVVGSTRLWREAPDEMNAAMARHHTIIHAAVARHGGWRPVEQGEGDSVFAAFRRPLAALTAAREIQRELADEAWPTPRPLTVRMGLHAGEVIQRDDNLYGDTVNRCARIRSAGSGGQVLVSAALHALVAAVLPAELGLVELGSHQLKDLSEPVQLWQLTAPDLPSDFPPLPGVVGPLHNLPAEPSTFIGREAELADVRELLEHHRLVTVTGFGGVGKTRLAVHVAAGLTAAMPDGVWLVDLSAVRDAARVPAEVAAVLRIAESASGAAESVLNALRDKELLLILDNLEQILDCAGFVASLLAAAPRLRVLATSREPLRISGEHQLALEPLALPPAAPRSATDSWVEHLSNYSAVQLFADRAAAVRADFALTTHNAPAVAAICSRLDGHALAIELAAARTNVLTPDLLLERLDSSLGLEARHRDKPDRHRTLRATIAWSYDALSADEQTLLDRLSVFPGTATLAAVEAICGPALGPTPAVDVVEVLTSLVDKSLVQTKPPLPGEQGLRYSLLVSIREFAAERLATAGLVGDLAGRHARWFAVLVPSEYPTLAEFQAGYAAVERDIHNMRAALGYLQTFGEPAEEVAFCPMFFGQLAYSGRFHECLAACRHGLGRSPEPAPGRVMLRWREAWVCERLGLDVAFRAAAHGMLEEAERLEDANQWVAFGLLFSLNASETADEARLLADQADLLLDSLPEDGPYPQRYLLADQRRVIHAMTLRFAEAERATRAAAEMVELARDADLELVARLLLAQQHLDAGRPDQALPLLRDALVRDESAIKPARLVQCAERSAQVMLQLGELDEAERHARDGIALAERLGGPAAALTCWLLLAEVALARADSAGVAAALADARECALLGDDPTRTAAVDWRRARLARQAGDAAAARELAVSAWEALEGQELRHLPEVVGCLVERAAQASDPTVRAGLAADAAALADGFRLPFGVSEQLHELSESSRG
jgi:predicted ATPase/class 3 adenylate cyclase